MARSSTHFIDVDGCVLHHLNEGPGEQWYTHHRCVEGAREALEAMEKNGDIIVLVTARPEWTRQILEDNLKFEGVPYHKLVMGLPNGDRHLHNDIRQGQLTAYAHNRERNEPWT